MMADVTPAWDIPYAESTDELCDGWLYIQEMAERVDAILDEFDVDLQDSQVVPLARASRINEDMQDEVSAGEIIFTAIDFDTTGLTNTFTPTAPIQITGEGRWLVGSFLRWDSDASSGTESMTVGSVHGLAFSNPFRQKVPGSAADVYGSTAFIVTTNGYAVDRIYTSGPASADVFGAYVWAWRIGDNP